MGRHGYLRSTGARVAGIAAVVYGLGVAFGTPLWGERFGDLWLRWGWPIVAVLFIVFLLVPWIRSFVADYPVVNVEQERIRREAKARKKKKSPLQR